MLVEGWPEICKNVSPEKGAEMSRLSAFDIKDLNSCKMSQLIS
jgi:hypothetical protein